MRVTSHHLCHIPWVTSKADVSLTLQRRGIHKGVKTRGQRSLEDTLVSVCHNGRFYIFTCCYCPLFYINRGITITSKHGFIQITALLSYNFQDAHRVVHPKPQLISQHFFTPSKNPDPLAVTFLPSPPKLQAATTVLFSISRDTPVFWNSHVNGIIQYIACCDLFLSFSIMFSRFICSVLCISTSFIFHDQIILHSVTISLFLFHSSVNGQLGCLPCLAFMNNAAVTFVYKFLCGHML